MANGWQRPIYGQTIDTAAYDAGLRQYMVNIYRMMAGGLALTGVVAWFLAHQVEQNPDLMAALYGTPMKWVIMFAPLVFVFIFAARIGVMSLSAAQTTFWVYAGLMGLSLASIFLVYTGQSVARVFFIAAATFGATSLYGYTTKTSLARFGSFLMMGVIGIIIASVVNIFVGSSALQFAISVIGVLVFTGLTAYDTQRLKEVYDGSMGEQNLGKLAVMGALTLYLDFINMFLMMLQLFGDRRS
ncbi:MAG: Bax inhibitor-1/YccA family protein [Candidatus Symbiobacter sp.]|nr:Bax inhibitor-1/YccA family protein [Candidatus Symbiobacter sp.]